MTDYLLRTIIETWWERVLRQLILLEAYYETDETVLALCANKAQLFPKFGMSTISDDMLMKEMTLTVNVGFGASDPNTQLQKFIAVTQQAIQIVSTAPPGFNVPEAIKELYSRAGYRDGSRFFNAQGGDPRLQQAMQMVQQLQQAMQSKQMETQANMQLEQLKLQSNEKIKGGQLQMDHLRINGDLAIRKAELQLEAQKIELEKMQIQAEMQGSSEERNLKLTEISANIEQVQLKLEGERQKIAGQAAKISQELEKGKMEMVNSAMEAASVARTEENVNAMSGHVSKSVESLGKEIQSIAQALENAKAGISEITKVKEQVGSLGEGLALVMGGIQKRNPSKLRVKKDGGKTKAIVVEFADGSAEEMPVE